MIREGTFREDLYYRLSVIPLTIPPLRERRDDIKLLMYHFLRKYNTFMNRKITGFTKEVEDLYINHDWPGNVRELENAVEYGTNMAFGDTIGMDEVPARLLRNEENVMKFQDTNLPLSEQVLQHPVGDPCGHRSGRSGAVLRQKADSRQVNRRSHG